MENPLDQIDFDEVVQHGDPNLWTFIGPSPGSPAPATSPQAQPGTMKCYDLYLNEFGEKIEVHYFRHLNGTVEDVKIK